MSRKNSKTLIAIAIYQLLYRFPYGKITVKMICEKAGVSRMSFYRYYSTKEDIFINFSDERFEEFYELYMKNNDGLTIEFFIENVIHYFHIYSRQIKLLEKADKMAILITQFERYASYLMNHVKSLALAKYKANPLAVPYFAGALSNVLVYWSKHNFKESEVDMANYFNELVATGLKK